MLEVNADQFSKEKLKQIYKDDDKNLAVRNFFNCPKRFEHDIFLNEFLKGKVDNDHKDYARVVRACSIIEDKKSVVSNDKKIESTKNSGGPNEFPLSKLFSAIDNYDKKFNEEKKTDQE